MLVSLLLFILMSVDENMYEYDDEVRDLNYSRVLDVHVWSDYPEVNVFVDYIYDEYFLVEGGNKRIKKKHLKVVLLDLYVAWLTDPDLNVGVHMTRDFYSKNFGTNTKRYNELNISAKTIDIVHTLTDVGLIGYKGGQEAQEGFNKGFISRIWSTSKLIELFKQSALDEFMIYSHHDRAVIVMRDEDKKDIPFEDNEERLSMASVVRRYNDLLERTFIDVGEANSPSLTIKKKSGSKNKNKPHIVHITHNGKFTRRIFNNSDWIQSGRFYGGFWQRISADLRKKILINDEQTVEVDFSALHPVLAYSKAGLDYWKEHKVGPYDISVRGVKDPGISRDIVKKLLLLALNASDKTVLFKAFRREFEYSSLGELTFKFTDKVLDEILTDIKEKHHMIANQIATGAGLKLMNLDSSIVEFVIKRFLEANTPVLSIHDSFIVQWSQRDRLVKAMEDAFSFVTGQSQIKYKQNVPTYQDAVAWRHLDRDFHLDRVFALQDTKRTRGYLNRLNKHNKFFNPKSEGSNSVQYMPDEVLAPKRYKKYQGL